MSEPHILVVSAGGYRLTCPGLTDACRAYEDCLCADLRDVDPVEDVAEAHGVEHRWLAGGWMVPTGRCLFVVSDIAYLGGDILINGIGMPDGRYLVRPTYDPDGDRFELGWTGAGRVRVMGDWFHGRLPVPGAVYVGRQAPGLGRSRWANPYRAGREVGGTRTRDHAHAVARYRELVESSGWKAQIRAELAGRMLACWCSPEVPCHSDHLLQVANAEEVAACSGQH